ncbi:SWI4-like isoform X2 [Octopus vulgaris]|uniref:SWI4-like isoform X2 n=1 Tax=Octopus vulgaris TaxID=6645 RepID=A0AA36F6H8_OCTVU|nr:SWI4-like isoform X2 [Octopus vulgaris]
MAASLSLPSRPATRNCKINMNKSCVNVTMNGSPHRTPHATSAPASAKAQISKKTIVQNGFLQNGFVSPLLSKNERRLSPVKQKTLPRRRKRSQRIKTLMDTSRRLSTCSTPRRKTRRKILKDRCQRTVVNKLGSEKKSITVSLKKKLSKTNSISSATQFRTKMKVSRSISKIQSTSGNKLRSQRLSQQTSSPPRSSRQPINSEVTRTPKMDPSPSLPTMMNEPLTPAETPPIHTADADLPSFLKDQAYPIKCPPFCNKCCTNKHSKLLLALLNCDDSTDDFKESVSFKNFLNTINYYEKKNWRRNSAIFDVNPEYRYPLMHWAAILSKLNILKWLASAGYNINVLHTNTGDTALHRVLLCIRAIRLNNPVMVKKFPQILEILEPNLKIKNRAGLTPFLTSCETVGMDGRAHYRNVDLLRDILNFAKERPGLLNILFNQQTKHGQSALHLIALNDKALGAMKMLVAAGANVQCLNKEGQTPFSLAVNLGQLRVAQYLEKHSLNITPPCIDTPLSSAPSSRASSSNSPSESNGDHLLPHEATDVGPSAVSSTSNAASDASTPPFSKRIKVEGSLPSDYESDVSENTGQYSSSGDYPSKVKHVFRKCSNNTSDGILKQYFHICNDSARENLIASINMDKNKCLQDLKVTEERLAALSRQIESICTEKHKKETEIRRLMIEIKGFDQSLEKLKEEKQELTEKSSSLDAKISLCVSVLKMVLNKNT